uniref:Uncharacterized protein n=1 Tax=Rhizophora mucronata TaxID=61149 RepID=A0A2P2P0U6_RHIMU
MLHLSFLADCTIIYNWNIQTALRNKISMHTLKKQTNADLTVQLFRKKVNKFLRNKIGILFLSFHYGFNSQATQCKHEGSRCWQKKCKLKGTELHFVFPSYLRSFKIHRQLFPLKMLDYAGI